MRNAKAYDRLVWAHPSFVEKTFVGGSKTVKFVNVFSLESFVLYGISNIYFNCTCVYVIMQVVIILWRYWFLKYVIIIEFCRAPTPHTLHLYHLRTAAANSLLTTITYLGQ